jgi:gelsolin
MVEADDLIGGIAVQHREVQGREGKKFRSYFNNKLQYLEGGVETGFTHVEPTIDTPFMYKVKGTQDGMNLTQVPLKKSSLNQGDSFILFANNSTVWVWHGTSSNPDEKARAVRFGESMCTEGTVVVLEGEDSDDGFWGHLGDGEIADAEGGDEDVDEFSPILYKLPARGDVEKVGEAETQKFGKPPSKLSKSLLEDSDMFLLDNGWEIYVWIGSGTDQSEKLVAMQQAEAFARKDPRTTFLPIALVKSGYEDDDFLSHFDD